MDGQTQIPEALMGAMLIEQGAQKGQFQPVTREGQPTVAARLMQQATPQPAGVEQALGQAGLAAQIQAMQAQQAQQALMQQAMAQRQPQMLARGGLANLNVDIDGFADGGIVGYAEGGKSQEERDREAMLETIRKVAAAGYDIATLPGRAILGAAETAITRPLRAVGVPIPYLPESVYGGDRSSMTPYYDALRREEAAQSPENVRAEQDRRVENMDALRAAEERIQSAAAPAPSPAPETRVSAPQATGIAATSPAAAFYDQARGALEKLKSSPVSQQAGVTAGLEAMAADDEMRRKLGLPTLAEQYSRMSEEDKALVAERQALIAGRLREAQEKRSSGQLGAFLRSARGRSLGETLGAAERGREAFESGLTGQIRGFEDLQLEIKGLQIQRQNALNKARDDIAMGKKKEAMESLQNAQNKANEIALKEADLYRFQAGTTSEEFRTRMTTEEQARGRTEAAKLRETQEESRVLLAAQGRLTEAEKARAQVVEKNRDRAALPKDSKDPITKQLRESAENEIRQADANVASARALYNRLLDKNLGTTGAPSAGTVTMDQLRAAAAQRGKSIEEAVAQAKAKGYTITGQ